MNAPHLSGVHFHWDGVVVLTGYLRLVVVTAVAVPYGTLLSEHLSGRPCPPLKKMLLTGQAGMAYLETRRGLFFATTGGQEEVLGPEKGCWLLGWTSYPSPPPRWGWVPHPAPPTANERK